ncbi:U7 snRNA-associated Sm-like protein LSm11 isoform X2 [Scleropages formosus]|uniref:U7 snRNA-associated Sm-like protein LSm11 isoform X2 n=1 Tax=Scleropages formosus TaxID=113540 RepID=UPI000878CB93|nr:U7 snRNA-associated Sm-like protein LSm11 isoform X2 [Scleropages formosus]
MDEEERKMEGNLWTEREKDKETSCARNRDEADNADIDSKLDVSSDQFDPLLALYSPEIRLPYPNIRCFNNISEYESFLKGGRGRAKPQNVEKKRRKAQKGVADPERIERLKKLMVNAAPAEEQEEGEPGGGGASRRSVRMRKAPKNVLTRMPLHTGSPLGELFRCVQERIRVKVHIRTFKGLRGVCSGFVVAFDKFWNLAMVDVDETYRKPLLGEAIHHERALTVTRLFDRLKLQESPEFRLAQQKQAVLRDTEEKTLASETSVQEPIPTDKPGVGALTPRGQGPRMEEVRSSTSKEGHGKMCASKP